MIFYLLVYVPNVVPSYSERLFQLQLDDSCKRITLALLLFYSLTAHVCQLSSRLKFISLCLPITIIRSFLPPPVPAFNIRVERITKMFVVKRITWIQIPCSCDLLLSIYVFSSFTTALCFPLPKTNSIVVASYYSR